jgi:hypothetical protein
MVKPKTDEELYKEVLLEIKVKDYSIEQLSFRVCQLFHQKKKENTPKQKAIKY